MFQDNFALGIKNNVGNIISGINGDTSGLAITGKKVAINGDTTVNGDFWTKNVNAVKVNASNITAGTIDAKKVNLINLNANQITTGTLQGIAIDLKNELTIQTGGLIRWNTDSTVQMLNDDYKYWGETPDKKPYVKVAEKGFVEMNSKKYIRMEGQLTAPNGGKGGMWLHSDTKKFRNSAYAVTRLSAGGLENEVFCSKATLTTDVSHYVDVQGNHIAMGFTRESPNIKILSNGNIVASTLSLGPTTKEGLKHSADIGSFGPNGSTPSVFAIKSYGSAMLTSSNSSNVRLSESGAFYRTSSKRAKKTDIRHDFTLEQANALVDSQPATWHDKAELDRTSDAPLEPMRHFGMVAEELEQAGLSQLVEYDQSGNVMSIAYDRLAIALIPVIKSLREKVGELEYKLIKLKEN